MIKGNLLTENRKNNKAAWEKEKAGAISLLRYLVIDRKMAQELAFAYIDIFYSMEMLVLESTNYQYIMVSSVGSESLCFAYPSHSGLFTRLPWLCITFYGNSERVNFNIALNNKYGWYIIIRNKLSRTPDCDIDFRDTFQKHISAKCLSTMNTNAELQKAVTAEELIKSLKV